MTLPEILGTVLTAFTIATVVQAWGNRSVNQSIDAKVAVPLSKLDAAQQQFDKSLNEHKVSSNVHSEAQMHALEAVRLKVGGLAERVAVVEDRTALILRSGTWGSGPKGNAA